MWAAQEAIELAEQVGFDLDEWQQYCLRRMMRERGTSPDAGWKVRSTGVFVPRQNGKGGLLEARELAGLFLWGERGVHTAHEIKTAASAFKRLEFWIENNDWLRKQVRAIRKSNGREAVEMHDGRSLVFGTRTSGAGRGLTAELLIIDEAQEATDDQLEALVPVQSAVGPRAQTLWTGSAGDDEAEVWARLRERGLTGDDPRSLVLDWSAPEDCDIDDPRFWAMSNPAFNVRVMEETVSDERGLMSDDGFARERLGIWQKRIGDPVIDERTWRACMDPTSTRRGAVAFAVDVTPDRKHSAIGVAGRRADGLWHLEVVQVGEGTDWITARVAELVERHNPCATVLDRASPAASLINELTRSGVDLLVTGPQDMAQACGAFFDAATASPPALRHIDQPPLSTALGAATKRRLGDAWAWQRRDTTDISPLVAVTLAMWGHDKAHADGWEPTKKRRRAAAF